MIAMAEGATYLIFFPSLKSCKQWVLEKNAPRNQAKSSQNCVMLDKTLILSQFCRYWKNQKKMETGQRQEQSFPAL